jgi:hypothetical protein
MTTGSLGNGQLKRFTGRLFSAIGLVLIAAIKLINFGFMRLHSQGRRKNENPSLYTRTKKNRQTRRPF